MPRKKQPLTALVRVEFTPERKREFLKNLRKLGQFALAAESVGVSTMTVLDHRKKDKAFADQVEEARQHWIEETLVQTAVSRAVKGVKRAVIGGKDRDRVIMFEQEYSDGLLSQLLRAHKPEFNKGAEGGPSDGGGLGGGGGVLIVPAAPHSVEDWLSKYSEAAKGTTRLGPTP